MTWESLLFCHWPVPAGALRALVPPALEIDAFDGTAWVGLIPFTMPVFRCTWLPPLPGARRFHECNVRTYVRAAGEPGVYFFSLDAASRLAVWGARRFFRLNYHAAQIHLRKRDGVVDYSVDRAGAPGARMRCSWRIGAERSRSRPGGLDHFLTERYALFTMDRTGRPRRGRIHHDPWPLREAELLHLKDGLVSAAGITIPHDQPVLYAADHLDVMAWPLEPPQG